MSNHRPKKILISGWYGHGNTGDEALLRVFCRELRQRIDADITVLSENPDGVLQNHPDMKLKSVAHYPLITMAGISHLVRGDQTAMLSALRTADLFVLGGGSILRDNTTWRNFMRVTDELWLAYLFGIPSALYSIGVGPFKTSFGQWLAARAARTCKVITVRDEASSHYLTDEGIAKDRIDIVTDPAFLLPAQKPEDTALGNDFCALLKEGPGKLAFIYPAPLPTDHALPREVAMAVLARGLEKIRDQLGLKLVFIPMHAHGVHDDIAISRTLIELMENPSDTHIFRRILKPEAVKYLTRIPVLNICVRLHAFVFAAAEGRKALAINYEPKVRNNARSFGVEEHVIELDRKMDVALVEKARTLMELRSCYIPSDRISTLSEKARIPFDRMAAILAENMGD